jgi:hypothetical protein
MLMGKKKQELPAALAKGLRKWLQEQGIELE